jgi:adenosylhomocysteine nucleosidase
VARPPFCNALLAGVTAAVVLVLAALAFEAGPLARALAGGPVPATVAATGVGPVAARDGARALIRRHRPRMVLGCGLCGALEERWRPGSVALPERLLCGCGGPALWTSLGRGPVPCGALLTVRRPAALPEEKAALATRFGAQWVDQETYAWAAAAAESGLPFAALRVVLDGYGEALPVWRRPGSWPAAVWLPGRALAVRRHLILAARELVCALS